MNRMSQLAYIATVSYVVVALPSNSATAADERADAADRARQFWQALSKADANALKEFYAPQVTLKAGSELLKPEWGLSERADRSKDLLVDRDELLAGYQKLFDRVGREKWTAIFMGITADKIDVFTATEANKPFGGVKPADTILKVATGPGDDLLIFILRKDKKGKLLVHLEATDY